MGEMEYFSSEKSICGLDFQIHGTKLDFQFYGCAITQCLMKTSPKRYFSNGL